MNAISLHSHHGGGLSGTRFTFEICTLLAFRGRATQGRDAAFQHGSAIILHFGRASRAWRRRCGFLGQQITLAFGAKNAPTHNSCKIAMWERALSHRIFRPMPIRIFASLSYKNYAPPTHISRGRAGRRGQDAVFLNKADSSFPMEFGLQKIPLSSADSNF